MADPGETAAEKQRRRERADAQAIGRGETLGDLIGGHEDHVDDPVVAPDRHRLWPWVGCGKHRSSRCVQSLQWAADLGAHLGDTTGLGSREGPAALEMRAGVGLDELWGRHGEGSR